MGISSRAVRENWLGGLPADAMRIDGRQRLYRGRAVYDAALKRELDKHAVEAGGDPDLAVDADSPALERYRLAKARLTELELERQTAATINRDAMKVGLAEIAKMIRQGCEALQRQFGREAHQVIDEVLEDVQRKTSELLG